LKAYDEEYFDLCAIRADRLARLLPTESGYGKHEDENRCEGLQDLNRS